MAGGRDYGARVTGLLPASPTLVWGILADTNRWDRLAGVTPSTYTFELEHEGDPTSRTRIGHCRFFGLPLHFAEEGDWWEGGAVRGERRFRGFVGTIITHAGLDLDLSPVDGGTQVALRCYAHAVRPLGHVIAALAAVVFWFKLRRYLRAVRGALALAAARMPTSAMPADIPAAAAAHRALLAAGPAPRAATGRQSASDQAVLVQRAAVFAEAPIDPAVRARLLELVATQPDEALVQLRPFEVAAAWGAERREVLRAFLHAARAGLFDLEWQVNCPGCRTGSEAAPHLGGLARRVHCDECEISFDVDFADNVEATFTINPAVRRVARVIFCASTPWLRPHLYGYIRIAPRSQRAIGPLPDGPLLLRARGSQRTLRIGEDARRGGAVLAVRVTDGGIELAAAGTAPLVFENAPLALDNAPLAIENATDRPVRLCVERAGWSADLARGSLLCTLPDFFHLFGTEAPAAGVQLAVGILAVVFTDVVGSTSLYERLGDARAFALIQEHYRAVERIVTTRHGALVKTLGDGTMCSFATVAEGAEAALDILDHAAALEARAGCGFALRAGLQLGACYAVRGNGRLDLFGQTVNLASRLAAAAPPQQLAMPAKLLDQPTVRGLIARRGLHDVGVRATIRGLDGVHELAMIDSTGSSATASTSAGATTAPPRDDTDLAAGSGAFVRLGHA